jgi:hypothetical protein
MSNSRLGVARAVERPDLEDMNSIDIWFSARFVDCFPVYKTQRCVDRRSKFGVSKRKEGRP